MHIFILVFHFNIYADYKYEISCVFMIPYYAYYTNI